MSQIYDFNALQRRKNEKRTKKSQRTTTCILCGSTGYHETMNMCVHPDYTHLILVCTENEQCRQYAENHLIAKCRIKPIPDMPGV